MLKPFNSDLNHWCAPDQFYFVLNFFELHILFGNTSIAKEAGNFGFKVVVSDSHDSDLKLFPCHYLISVNLLHGLKELLLGEDQQFIRMSHH